MAGGGGGGGSGGGQNMPSLSWLATCELSNTDKSVSSCVERKELALRDSYTEGVELTLDSYDVSRIVLGVTLCCSSIGESTSSADSGTGNDGSGLSSLPFRAVLSGVDGDTG
mmetsp:Transcript_16130/g.35054  ORF Transcript_16130/g.35054 Transcript_16130/m.35054 type:complete len:112 (-) Transcript_16130:1152-1487(-)